MARTWKLLLLPASHLSILTSYGAYVSPSGSPMLFLFRSNLRASNRIRSSNNNENANATSNCFPKHCSPSLWQMSSASFPGTQLATSSGVNGALEHDEDRTHPGGVRGCKWRVEIKDCNTVRKGDDERCVYFDAGRQYSREPCA
jgi:hypothetical protein